MPFVSGPFCGKFRDELGDSDSDEDDGTNMRAKNKKAKRPLESNERVGRLRRRPKKERNVASTNMMWV